MLIKLSDRVPFWFQGELHFSMDDPGPKEVDLDSLDPETKNILRRSVELGSLLVVGEDYEQPETAPIITEDKKVVDPRLVLIEKRAGEALKGSAKTVIAFCKKRQNHSFQLLSSMLKIEEGKQKRKTVIKMLNDLLEQIGGVSRVIEDDSDIDEVKINIG